MGSANTSAKRVIQLEAEALNQLAKQLTNGFQDAVTAITGATGRVVVSGMGKSGHVARKIASTLASTGTPAHFVHPAEASHGDLGMLTRKDVLLVLSNSGETPELEHIVSHATRYAIPLIAMATDPESTLMRAADIPLQLPQVEEACPLGLAPTTSTISAMALGDALAVAVMEQRSFTAENFRMLHPGGRLGAKLLTVRHLMHDGDTIPLTAETATMEEALMEMSEKAFGITGVVDDEGALIGVISDGDIRRNMPRLMHSTAGEVATRDPKIVAPETLAIEAAQMMNDSKILCLFVIDDDAATTRPIGLLHIHDCVRAGLV